LQGMPVLFSQHYSRQVIGSKERSNHGVENYVVDETIHLR
jgi:hypothetical protein